MNKVILLVEDNESDEKLTVHAFRKCGVANELVVVRDGVEALEYLTASGPGVHPLPAFVLLDVNLPRIGGLDVLRRLRADARTKLLPVIMLTSSKQDEDLVTSYSLGANAYVRKPVDFTRFAEVAKTLALFWLVLNEAPPPDRS